MPRSPPLCASPQVLEGGAPKRRHGPCGFRTEATDIRQIRTSRTDQEVNAVWGCPINNFPFHCDHSRFARGLVHFSLVHFSVRITTECPTIPMDMQTENMSLENMGLTPSVATPSVARTGWMDQSDLPTRSGSDRLNRLVQRGSIRRSGHRADSNGLPDICRHHFGL